MPIYTRTNNGLKLSVDFHQNPKNPRDKEGVMGRLAIIPNADGVDFSHVLLAGDVFVQPPKKDNLNIEEYWHQTIADNNLGSPKDYYALVLGRGNSRFRRFNLGNYRLDGSFYGLDFSGDIASGFDLFGKGLLLDDPPGRYLDSYKPSEFFGFYFIHRQDFEKYYGAKVTKTAPWKKLYKTINNLSTILSGEFGDFYDFEKFLFKEHFAYTITDEQGNVLEYGYDPENCNVAQCKMAGIARLQVLADAKSV